MASSTWAPACVAASLFLIAGGFGAFSVSRHHDEDEYVWASGYLVHQIATGDTKFATSDGFSDPHWNPLTPWALGMGTSTRAIYGLGLVLTPRTSAPAKPYSWTDPALQGPETLAARTTLVVERLLAVLCAAIGIALIARRFGWAAVAAAAVLLLLPNGVTTFSRAWAEGPLLLAFGLCSLAYGTTWFAPMLGIALTVKLTALGLWPLVLLRRARVIPLWKATVAMIGTFVLLTPPSLAFAGPLFIVKLIVFRGSSYSGQSSDGAFLPSRYFWPFELAAVLIAFELVKRARGARLRGRSVSDCDKVPGRKAQQQVV